jgi:hypothetical protein
MGREMSEPFTVNSTLTQTATLVENKKTNLMSLAVLTSCALNVFQTLIYPSSGACDVSVESPHWSCVLGSMCVGVSVWLGWSGIRVAG